MKKIIVLLAAFFSVSVFSQQDKPKHMIIDGVLSEIKPLMAGVGDLPDSIADALYQGTLEEFYDTTFTTESMSFPVGIFFRQKSIHIKNYFKRSSVEEGLSQVVMEPREWITDKFIFRKEFLPMLFISMFIGYMFSFMIPEPQLLQRRKRVEMVLPVALFLVLSGMPLSMVGQSPVSTSVIGLSALLFFFTVSTYFYSIKRRIRNYKKKQKIVH